jgi:hypothetical protein
LQYALVSCDVDYVKALVTDDGIDVKTDFLVNCRKDIKIHSDRSQPKYISFVWAGDEYVIDEVNNSIVISQH